MEALLHASIVQVLSNFSQSALYLIPGRSWWYRMSPAENKHHSSTPSLGWVIHANIEVKKGLKEFCLLDVKVNKIN